jgi:hypothetical protein
VVLAQREPGSLARRSRRNHSSPAPFEGLCLGEPEVHRRLPRKVGLMPRAAFVLALLIGLMGMMVLSIQVHDGSGD